MQLLVSMIFNNEIQRPSSEKLWQMPQPDALPIPPDLFGREVPLDAQDTSYFADSVSIFNLFRIASFIASV